MGSMTDPKRSLDDPDYAAFAWARFRRIMIWMAIAAAAMAAAALIWLSIEYGSLSLATVLAVVFGIGATVLLAAALMGLIFLSSGTGHDEAVDDLPRKRKDRRHS